MKKLTNITASQIAQKGVQALADRPNATQQYGTGGLSATQLKLWFDKLASFLADKINAIHEVLSGEDAAEYIRIALDGYGIDDLRKLVEAITSGSFARDILHVYPSASAEEMVTLQVVLNDFARQISDHEERIDEGYVTFTPSVSEDGYLSWSNDKGRENPAPVNIKGPQGDVGADGYTPIRGVDYWTAADQQAIVDSVLTNFTNASEVAM